MHRNLIAAIGVLSMLSISISAGPNTKKTTAKGPVKSSKVKSSKGKNNVDKENKVSVTPKNPENSKKGPVKSSKVKSSKGKNNVDKENKASVTLKNPENSASSIPAHSDQENTDFVPPAEAVSAGVFDFKKIHDYKIDYGQHKGKVAPIYGLRVRIEGKEGKNAEKFKKKFALSNEAMNALNSLPEQEKEKKIAEWHKWFRKEMPKDKALVHTICDYSFRGTPWMENGFFDRELYNIMEEGGFLLGFYIPGEDSSKDPIILVHGGPGGDGEGMLDLAANLSAETGRSVLAYIQRGCEGSAVSFDLLKDTFQQSAQDLDKVIDATLALSGKKRVVLGGHSLGTTLVNEYLGTMDKGKVSSYIAAGPAETDLMSFVRREVNRSASCLINASKLKSNKPIEEQDGASLEGKLKNNVSKTYFSNFDNAKDYYKREQSEELFLLREKINSYYNISGRGCADSNNMIIDFCKRLKDPKGQEMLKNIRVPTLIIAGEHDILDPKSAKITADKIRNSELHVMKDAAHWMFREKPEEFYPLVKNFLDRVDAGKKIGTGKIKDLESMGKKVRIPQDKNVPAA